MDINLLKEFITISEDLNFTKAAKKLHMAQPVLSRHIASLEDQLGVQLFIRNQHSVQLTYIGELMLTEAKAIVARFEEAIQKIRLTAAGYIGSLKIGFLEGAVKNFLTKLILHFKDNYPSIDLQLVSLDLGTLTQSLESKGIDIGFTLNMDTYKKEDICIKTVYRDFYSVVVPKNHPLADKSNVNLADLVSEQFIMPSPEQFPGAMDRISKLCFLKGFTPNIVKQAPRLDTVLLMIEIGQGVAIMPRHDEAYANSNIRFVDIVNEDAFVDVVVAWRKSNTNPLIAPFLEALGLII